MQALLEETVKAMMTSSTSSSMLETRAYRSKLRLKSKLIKILTTTLEAM